MTHTPTILITGATDGIGRQTAEELAATGANLILHGRSAAKLELVVAALETIAGHGQLDTIVADLSDLDDVRRLAEQVDRELGERGLDVLLNNAGVFENQRRYGAQGHELTWVVNYLAPFLLSHLLLPALRRSGRGRIVNVSSVAHVRGTLRWDDLQHATAQTSGPRSGVGSGSSLDASQDFSAYAAYAQSKLALVMFTTELARRLGGDGPLVVALHPGVVSTKLLTEGFGMHGPDSLGDGAATSIYLALVSAEQLEPNNGAYFVRKRVAPTNPMVADHQARSRLYDRTCELLGLDHIGLPYSIRA